MKQYLNDSTFARKDGYVNKIFPTFDLTVEILMVVWSVDNFFCLPKFYIPL